MTQPQLSAEQIKQRAQAWYERQLTSIAKAHGASWPKHKEWVEDHLKEELRERLIRMGWRAK